MLTFAYLGADDAICTAWELITLYVKLLFVNFSQ